MQLAPLAQALGPPVRQPNTIGSECAPILKRSNVRMQRALTGCITNHQQRTRLPQPHRPSKAPNIGAQGGMHVWLSSNKP